MPSIYNLQNQHLQDQNPQDLHWTNLHIKLLDRQNEALYTKYAISIYDTIQARPTLKTTATVSSVIKVGFHSESVL